MSRLLAAAVLAMCVIAASGGPAAASPSRVGLMTDVGVPDGATLSLVVRPIAPLRVHVGASHNLVGPGVRAGLTLAPIPWWCSPTLSASAGYFPERDANGVARMISGDPTYSSPLLERFGYAYAEAHAGFAFGRRHATLYVEGGLARVVGNVRNLAELATGDADAMASVSYTEDPNVTVTTVSARIGLVIYIP